MKTAGIPAISRVVNNAFLRNMHVSARSNVWMYVVNSFDD